MTKDNAAERLPVVDETGRVIGSATRGECHSGTFLLHPVVHLHVFNSAGELYLQKRPDWKDIQPGRWDTAVGGHVDFGEDVGSALRREAMEEIGLTRFTPRFLDRYVYESDRERELINAYMTQTDTALHPSDEVADGRFFTPHEICQRLGTGYFTPQFEQEWHRLFAPTRPCP